MQNSRQKIFKITFIFLSALFAGTLIIGIWSWYSNIEESVTGMGQIVPKGKVRRIMSPMNGTVAQVHIEENEEVKAGQILVELDPEYSEIQENTYQEQLAYLRNEIHALKSATGKENKSSNLGSTQNAWLSATKGAYQAQIESTQMQISKIEHLKKQSLEKQKQLKELLASNNKLLERQEQLLKEGGISENDVEIQKQKVVQFKGDLASADEEIQAREAEYKQSLQQLKEIDGSYQKEIFSRLAEHEQNILRFNSEVARAGVDIKRQVIKAPFDGIVNEQAIRGIGEVATAGQVLLSLVPLNSELAAELKVTNREMSYIYLGQKVIMKVDAFPYHQYERLEGKVESISPSTVEDREGRSFYVIRVKLNKQKLKNKQSVTKPLRAGMTLTADIITRERNIMSFFLEPVQDNLEKAFKDPSDR